jgi:basic amino acid/polyamine antiporter, APA family
MPCERGMDDVTVRSPLLSRILARKPVELMQNEANTTGLKRTLGPTQLVLFGIGIILGAGIYVMPGNAAANYAGPAVVLSFVIAGAACALTGLCYAELASMIPVSGSAYNYCYAAVGEIFAWSLGWLMLFDYGLGVALIAVGFSAYFVSLAAALGIHIPVAAATPFVNAVPSPGGYLLSMGSSVNLIASAAICVVTCILVVGISASARTNSVLVAIKLAVLLIFLAIGVGAVDPQHWVPFIPENQGGFVYGWPGILRGASILFYAYLGFETVSTAATEARNPRRDVPIGTLGSLAVCTVLYVIVAAVLTGIVPYRELGVPDPIAFAADRTGHPHFALLVKLGALAGLSSVLLITAYGQSRVAFAMSRDGLLPAFFARLHERYRTPYLGTLLLGFLAAVSAALLPLALLGDLVSLGVGLSFATVAFSVMWLRTTRPDLPRSFRVPLGGITIGRVWIGFVPAGSIAFCIVMMLPIGIDITSQSLHGHPLPALIIGGYALLGALVYFGYGLRQPRTWGTSLTPPTP